MFTKTFPTIVFKQKKKKKKKKKKKTHKTNYRHYFKVKEQLLLERTMW